MTALTPQVGGITLRWHPMGGCDGRVAEVDRLEWEITGVSIRSGSALESRDRPARLRVRRESEDRFVVDVPASSFAEAVSSARPVLVALAAFIKGWIAVRGTVVAAREASHGVLVIGEAIGDLASADQAMGPHLLVDPGVPEVRCWPEHLIARGVNATSRAVTLDGVVLLADDGPNSYVPPKMLQSHLRAHLLLPTSGLAAALNGTATDFLHSYERHCYSRSEEVAAGLPAYATSAADLAAALHENGVAAVMEGHPAPLARYAPRELASLREMQRVAGEVYGRLESERALSWAAEEFGEVARAIRRRDPPTRIVEELGQLFSWVLCLANITGVDIADSAGRALSHEALRQAREHGGLRPYRPASEYRSGT